MNQGKLLIVWALLVSTASMFATESTNSYTETKNKLEAAPNNSCTPGSNLALNGTIVNFSAEENATNTVQNILDENNDTRWSAETFPQHVTIDLGSVQNISEVSLSPFSERDYQFIVEGSSTSSTSGFSTLVNASNNTISSSLITKSFKEAEVRYVKLTITGAATYDGVWASINYLTVNCAGGSSSSNDFTGRYDLEDFQIETSWLTGENSRTTESFLATTKDNEDWYDKSGNNYVLKSLKTDGNRTEWKEYQGKESSLFTYKRMLYRAKVEDIPENGVTIAQVHNRGNNVNRPFLRVYIHDDGHIRVKVTKTDPSKSSSSYDDYEGPEYDEGTDFNLEILTDNGDVKVSITTTDGTMTETITPSNDWNEWDDSYYLKAGVYTEGDDTFPEITFDYFVVDKTGITLSNDDFIVDSLNKVTMYPNPFSDFINIDFSENLIAPVAKVKVIDAIGREIINVDRDSEQNSLELRTDALSTGFYIIQLLDENNKLIATKKAINK